MSTLKGGCLCGAVRFEADGDPLFSSNCHCRDCQRASGGGYLPLMAFPAAAVRVTGVVKSFHRRADSGASTSESFCPECAARLYGQADVLQGIVVLHAGALDDPTLYKPQIDIFAASAPPWDHMDPSLPKFPGMPPLGS